MTKATPESSDSLIFECDFEEPPEKVWRALTEPRLLETWLTADRPPRTDTEEGASASYEVMSAVPHRLVRYRWRDKEGGGDDLGGREVQSVVTFELAPRPAGGTHLRLTHGDFRIVSAAQPLATARVIPITSARRRRTPLLSCATQSLLRRAA
jgi:uncharacterized protein YndB with AHSA1/START domain